MAIDLLLKRHFWVLILLLSSLSSFFLAYGTTQLMGSYLAVDDKTLAAKRTPAARVRPQEPPPFHLTTAEPILKRNPFDSVTGPLSHPIEETRPVGAAPIVVTNPLEAPLCEEVKVAIIAASADPDWSFAALTIGSNKTTLQRRGGQVDGKTVAFISWDRVFLQGGSGLCQVVMFQADEAPSGLSTPVVPAPEAVSSGGASGVPPEIAQGIVRIGPTEFNVERSVVDKILENQADLMRQARIVPEQENGKVVGIRLFGVRQDTLLGVLGMENGDRIQSINGFDIANPEKALEAYARLRTADRLTLQMNRRGQPLTIDFNIK